MGQLKVGDFVEVNFPADPKWNGQGTITHLDRDYIQVRLASGGSVDRYGWFGEENLRLVAARVSTETTPPGLYEPRDGDDITISMRGKVSGPVAGGWDLTNEGGNLWMEDYENYEVTVHSRGPETMPTTPGSSIHCLNTEANYFLTDQGWVSETGVNVTIEDPERFAACAVDGEHEVIFDAGASK